MQIVIAASKIVSSSHCVRMNFGFPINWSSRINTLIKLFLPVETEETDEDQDEADEDLDEADLSHELKEEIELENEADPTEDEDNEGI